MINLVLFEDKKYKEVEGYFLYTSWTLVGFIMFSKDYTNWLYSNTGHVIHFLGFRFLKRVSQWSVNSTAVYERDAYMEKINEPMTKKEFLIALSAILVMVVVCILLIFKTS